MSVTRFGIFLAYGPTVDLKKEGLGRLLAAFLRAAAAREDVRFVIACPHWSTKPFLVFCESEGIPSNAFEVICTEGVPFFLKVYLALRMRKAKASTKGRFAKFIARFRSQSAVRLRNVTRSAVSARSMIPWLLIGFLAIVLGVVLVPVAALARLLRAAYAGLRAGIDLLRRPLSKWIAASTARLLAAIEPYPGESVDVLFYRLMEEAEIERMVRKINALVHVKAWYSPTAFWPGFNRISAPHLLCVPDVVTTEFPVGFSQLEPELLQNTMVLERSIRSATHFVTYSSRVKWNTLVGHYRVNPDAISVIPHADCDLSSWISARGFDEQGQATRRHCEQLLQQVLSRAADAYVRGLTAGSLRFLFYASQFRPNKNLLTLLRAYEYLVRERFIPHKLILTGDPNRFPPVADFVREQHLGKDVLCLHGLTTTELAACYHLADLAVNPSLSEGACPFTLTEAISVGTPVIMARIPVTEEVIQDPVLQEMMLFDPYDWRDAVKRIERALQDRESLLETQREFCARRQRDWRAVVDEYVDVLNQLAAAPSAAEAK